MDKFASPNILLSRAKMHITELRTWLDIYKNQEVFENITHYDQRLNQTFHKLRLTVEPPAIVAAIAFDALNCLRSALDHAVYEASVELGAKPKPKYTKFPFGDDAAAAAADLPRKRAEVPDSIRPLLLSFKPYKAENGGNGVLWGLNNLRNSKIHQILTPFISRGVGTHVHSGLAIGAVQIRSDWDSESRMYTYCVTEGHLPHFFQFRFSVNVAFDDSTAFSGKLAFDTFVEMAQLCDRIVAEIQAETYRLQRDAS